jgi:hypothetical protein
MNAVGASIFILDIISISRVTGCEPGVTVCILVGAPYGYWA